MIYKRSWFPSVANVVTVKYGKVSYIHSLWVGLTAPLFELPIMIYRGLIKPLTGGLLAIILVIFSCWFAGIRGRAAGYTVVSAGNK